MIRRGTWEDVDAVVDLAVEAVSPHARGLHVCRDRIRDTITQILSDDRHFQVVAVDGGDVVGAMSAMVTPIFYAERCHASVLMFYTRVPGTGIEMIRAFARWIRENRAVRTASVAFEHGMDTRIQLIFERLGFQTRRMAVFQKG